MKYIFILTWCVKELLSVPDSINIDYKESLDCNNAIVYQYKINAEEKKQEMVNQNKLSRGYITLENIEIDSVLVDTSISWNVIKNIYEK